MAYTYKKYEESDAVKQAKANLDAQISQKPGAYQSQWQTQLDDTLKKIQNREKFNYNINADALYQSYKDKYVRQGQQAMQDTMGQAAALTGGYGSSYGQNAGQQAYNAYLQNLGDVVPELYEIARSRYDQEGADLMNMYGLLGDNEAQDYGRWQDQQSAWQSERDYLAGLYDAERAYDYGKYTDDRDFSYAQYRDQVSDEQWAKQFAAAQAARRSGSSGGNNTASKAPTLTTNKSAESAKGNGVTSYSNVMKTVNAYLSMGKENQALEMIDSIYPQLSAAQKKDVDALLKKLGYVYE
jgi:hypothetical protein